MRFCWIFVGRLAGPPSPPYLVHPRSRQCFQAFCNTFHAQSCCDFFLRPFPKRLAQGARPVQNSFPQTASPFVARDRGSLQILGLELASEDIPHRIRASGLPPGAFAVISQDRGTAQEGLGSVTIASDQVAIPTAHGRQTHRVNPEALVSETRAN